MFSIVVLTFISCIYFGALSGKVGGFDWKGSALVGIAIGLFGQVLIFTATLVSYLADLQTYFVHWDALNVPEGTAVPMAAAMASRAGGLFWGGVVSPAVIALIGRALGALAPGCNREDARSATA